MNWRICLVNNFEAKLYINVKDIIEIENLFHFKAYPFYIIFGSVLELETFIENSKEKITKYYLEVFAPA